MKNRKDNLIEAQREYIEFLSAYIDSIKVYLHIHNMNPNKEAIDIGIQLREKIKQFEL